MRIVTRPDFDGVVCAALLYEAEEITAPVKWIQPNDLQKGRVDIRTGDIIANLPYDPRCSLWFDHHYSNRIQTPFKGAFAMAPSAAGIIYEYFKDRFQRNYMELIRATDKIDSAALSVDEVLNPQHYPYLLLSMTIPGTGESDESYWNKVVRLLRTSPVGEILDDPDVQAQCQAVIEQNKQYQIHLEEHTHLNRHVCITDFRPMGKSPAGNRFLVYALYPEAMVSVKIRYDDDARERVAVSVGHNIFNRNCNVNIGRMLSDFEGGGHQSVGSCRFHVSKADDYIPKIIDILTKNQA